MSRDYDAVQAVKQYGSIRAAAKALGKSRSTIQTALKAAGVVPVETPKATPAEVRDVSFWRNKAKLNETRAMAAEHLAQELSGIRAQEFIIPEYLLPEAGDSKGRVVPFLHATDWHIGEVIEPGEMNGVNAFNIEIARKRIRRFIDAGIELSKRWAADSKIVGCLLLLGGDLVSGDIHAELRETNALSSHEQVMVAVEELSVAIKRLLEAFGRVHVPAVPGNHGRTTEKNPFKAIGKASYDTLIASILSREFHGDSRVTFQIANGHDTVIPIFGKNVLLTHGDRIGTGGGQGFAGPSLPIIRGGKKVLAQYSSSGEIVDLILMGHYHHSTAPHGVLAGGSLPGYSEFAHGIRAGVDAPRQWVGIFHNRWFLRERMDVALDDVGTFEKPVVRVPAWPA